MATRGEGNQRLRPMTARCEHGIPAAVDGHFYAGIGENFSGTNLTDANLHRADPTGANLTEANLFSANLHGANLTEANLTGANLTDVIGANFTGAILSPPSPEAPDKLMAASAAFCCPTRSRAVVFPNHVPTGDRPRKDICRSPGTAFV